jgi:hypothetical protein
MRNVYGKNPFFKNSLIQLEQNPYENVNWDTDTQYKTSNHLHTTESDGAIYGSKVLQDYKNANYDIVILSDHDNVSLGNQPNNRGTQKYINSWWEWNKFEGLENYKAVNGTYLKDVETGVYSNGVLSVQASEFSRNHHFLALDCNFNGNSGNSLIEDLEKIKETNGIVIFAHPNVYNETATWYNNLYKNYPNIVGQEIYNYSNRKENGFSKNLDKWDEINLISDRLIFGYNADDMHTSEQYFKGYNYFIMPKLSTLNFRNALLKGNSYMCYEANGNGHALAPRIISILTDDTYITINATEEHDIKWYYNKQLIFTGKKINYAIRNIKYIRAKITGQHGITLTQPFKFK